MMNRLDPRRSRCVPVMGPESLQVSEETSHIQCQAGTGGDIVNNVSCHT